MNGPRRFWLDARPRANTDNNQDFVLASDYDLLAAQLARAREWMGHKREVGYTCPAGEAFAEERGDCTCGLTAFLKEIDES